MSDGRDDAGRKAAPRKFVPTMAARKKKAEGPAVTAADAAAASEAFKDLIKAAQSEARWERGRGRGRGRGREQKFQVAFGAGDSARAGGFLPSARKDIKVKDEEMYDMNDPGGAAEARLARKKAKPKKPVLDYTQYYPTMLPFRTPQQEELEGPIEASELLGALDLATAPEVEINAAEELGLVGDEPGADEMYLFQLPNLLPSRHVEPPTSQEEERKAGRGPTQAARPHSAASSLKELPSGKIGVLKMYASGAVKLQLGDVLLDVDPGMACGCRQEVAALNTSVGHCILMGDITQRVVVNANIYQLMGDYDIPDSGARLHSTKDPLGAKSKGVVDMEMDPADAG